MPFLNYEAQEIVFKVVYYGPGMSGKTTNLIHVHRTLAPVNRGTMVSLDTVDERTLFFDFLPLSLGKIGPFAVRLQLYTVPGQVRYAATRRLILNGADGVVFVADSQADRYVANLDSFRDMAANLDAHGRQLEELPLVLQYNKRDLPECIELGIVERELELNGVDVFEAVATEGRGVIPTVRRVSQLVVSRFRL